MTELRTAARSLRAWGAGSLGAVITLGLGIGAASSMYALVAALLGAEAPRVGDPPTLGRVYASSRALSVERTPLALSALDDVAAVAAFQSTGAAINAEGSMRIGQRVEPIVVAQVTSGFFRTLGVSAVQGRLLAGDEIAAGAPVVVVSDRLWRSHLAGADIGSTEVAIDGASRTIVGVLAGGFGGRLLGLDADAWVPASAETLAHGRAPVFARLRPDVPWAAASAAVRSAARGHAMGGSWTWTLVPVEADQRLRAGYGASLMFGPALVVLLIACTNVACMLLARGFAREAELGVRAALGASRGRLVRQLTLEHLLLAVAAGILGTGLARAALDWITAYVAQFPDWSAAIPPMPSLATLVEVSTTCSVAACLIFGLIPALRLSRRDLAGWLRGGTPAATARVHGYGVRDLIVFVEIGGAVALVVTTALFVRFFTEVAQIRPRYATHELVVTQVDAGQADLVADLVRVLPGVRTLATLTDLPGRDRPETPILVTTAEGVATRAAMVGAAPTAFDALGLAILRGRTFDAGERASDVVLVSQTLAERLWPGRDALGGRLTMTGSAAPLDAVVIGVVADAVEGGRIVRGGLIPPSLYVPFAAAPGTPVQLLVRTVGDAHVVMKPLRTLLTMVGQARLRPAVLSDQEQRVRPDGAFMVRVIGALGLVALLLAAAGIVGVVSQSVAQRTTEFGVRLALGASPHALLRMVLGREARLLTTGVATGVAGTLLVARATFVELLPIAATDARVWLGVAVLCGGIAATALLLATWRMVRLDPLEILRRL